MTVLTAVMTAGIVAIVLLLVTRLGAQSPPVPPPPALPPALDLPAGARAQAVTFGAGWIAIVTEDQRILLFDAGDGRLLRELSVAP